MTRVLTVLAAIAIWVTGAYPPWKLTFVVRADNSAAVVSTAVANDWLLTEKALPGRTVLSDLRPGVGYSVDFGRLAVEWVIIAALYAGSIVALRSAPAAPVKG